MIDCLSARRFSEPDRPRLRRFRVPHGSGHRYSSEEISEAPLDR